MAGGYRIRQEDDGISGIFRIVLGLVELLIGAMVLILGIAFVLGLFGANTDAPFAQWIYSRTAEIMTPFNGLFDPVKLNGDTTIQTSLLFAMVVYAAVGGLLSTVARRIANS